ncbi:Uncharacterised protein [Mycobacteroides abscessus subsp. abscessus]|nr:Uncharacterised protein [Mycobacteroides abscessus subsp. abscessus]SLG10046.1 Uncharacterised protein [Mycobacteroides abscessus subsp. abscessus]
MPVESTLHRPLGRVELLELGPGSHWELGVQSARERLVSPVAREGPAPWGSAPLRLVRALLGSRVGFR